MGFKSAFNRHKRSEIVAEIHQNRRNDSNSDSDFEFGFHFYRLLRFFLIDYFDLLIDLFYLLNDLLIEIDQNLDRKRSNLD